MVNRRSPVTGFPVCYSWVIMVVPLGSEGSGIPVLKGFMVAPGIRTCGLPSYKCITFTSLGNATWFNIVDVFVAAPILTVIGCLVVYF